MSVKFTRRSALRMALASVAASFVGTRAEANTKQIVRLSRVKVGGTFAFQLANGAPALLFRTKTGVFAYQTICTHQGGVTKYFSAKKVLVCPVHNASFDPFKKGAVITGPATNPLPTVKVVVQNGWVALA